MIVQPTQNEDVTIRNWMYPEVNQHRCEKPLGEIHANNDLQLL